MSAIDELLNFIFDNSKPPFYHEMGGWLRGVGLPRERGKTLCLVSV